MKLMARDWGSERGSVLVEMMLAIPIVIVSLMLIAWAGRGTTAEAETLRAANSAARVAALSDSGSSAQAAVAGIGPSSEMCVSLQLSVDTSEWNSGWVSVTAVCRPNTSGLSDLPVGSDIVRTSTAAVQQFGSRG